MTAVVLTMFMVAPTRVLLTTIPPLLSMTPVATTMFTDVWTPAHSTMTLPRLLMTAVVLIPEHRAARMLVLAIMMLRPLPMTAAVIT